MVKPQTNNLLFFAQIAVKKFNKMYMGFDGWLLPSLNKKVLIQLYFFVSCDSVLDFCWELKLWLGTVMMKGFVGNYNIWNLCSKLLEFKVLLGTIMMNIVLEKCNHWVFWNNWNFGWNQKWFNILLWIVTIDIFSGNLSNWIFCWEL